MASPQAQIQLTGLARRLVNDGLLKEADAASAQDAARRHRQPLVSYLVENKLLASREVAIASAHEFGVPLVDLNAIDLDAAPINLVAEKLIQQHHALPLFKRGARLFVAVSDPTNFAALDEIKFHTGVSTDAVLVEEDKLNDVLNTLFDDVDSSMSGLMDEDLDNLEISAEEEEPEAGNITELELDEAPVVRFVNKVLVDAINKGASDIHIETYEKSCRVRFRQDGVLHEIASPPVSLAVRIVARIKVMSRMDIAERRVPQDGRIRMHLSKNRSIDFRVNTCPTLYGEKIVLRILDPAIAKMGIDMLGYEDEQKRLFLEAINKPYGMVLVTGPTGSGKTVSLYTALNILNTPDRNISTVEDPVEINVQGINQVNMNPKAGLTFGTALRAFLRQDPDIIMLGEIRDLETAEIGIKAAQTGHLVLSTLHTNDAPQTMTRLVNMGIPAYNIASAVHLIIAQRLARRLCSNCKQPMDIPDHALVEAGFSEDEASDLEIFEPVGCPQCTRGYKGRVGIYQVMPVSGEMGRIIMDGGNAIQIGDQATVEGIPDLRASSLEKVRQGVTSLEEINRVTKD